MRAFAIQRPATAFAHDKSSKATASFKDEKHLAFIRELPCVITGAYGCEACHIRMGSAEHNKKRTGKGVYADPVIGLRRFPCIPTSTANNTR